jgi:phenylpyruvate tautomerase PptA (4-oxalocrotonate tautomerase family)
MPLYRCTVLAGLTSESQRARIAKEVVRIHCGITGAPASFVHAFFAEAPAEELPAGRVAFMLGSIRWGRSDEQKARLVAELTDVLADVTGRERDEVGVATVDVPSKWIMEGGDLLPEPGEEEAWLAKHGSA